MITLTVPLPSNRANSSVGGWVMRYRDGQQFDKQAVARTNPRPPATPLTRVRVAYHVVHGGNLMDWDNLFARLKHAQDWLVKAGYLVDDNAKIIPECPVVTQTPKAKKPERRVEITITPLDALSTLPLTPQGDA
jgi:Holliday junction resolvase RusA-like endonuclease